MVGSEHDLPSEFLASLSRSQPRSGIGLFMIAIAFIVLHELAHLKLRHERCEGPASIEQEKEADRFAAEWLLNASDSSSTRCNNFLGIAIALLWLTVFNVYIGPGNYRTHPSGYDRLYQVLHQNLCATTRRNQSSCVKSSQ